MLLVPGLSLEYRQTNAKTRPTHHFHMHPLGASVPTWAKTGQAIGDSGRLTQRDNRIYLLIVLELWTFYFSITGMGQMGQK